MFPHALHLALFTCRRALSFAAAFSLVVNLLTLTTSIYMIQIYDRVLASRSIDTLLYLTLITFCALMTLGLLEMSRSRLLVKVGTFLEESVAPDAFRRSLDNSLRGRRYRSEAVRDLRELRGFLTSPAILALFDLPWAPLFLVAIFMLHPVLGVVAAAAVLLLFALALLNDRLSRPRLRTASEIGVQAMQELEAYNRNAEIIDALGMLPAVAARWLRRNGEALRLQALASNTSGMVLGVSRFCRLAVQVLMLGTGALLVMRQELTGGAMVAGSIILGRALGPIDQAIAGWKQLIGARAAYRRLNDCLSEPPLRPAGTRLPAPNGELKVEQAGFASPATGRTIVSDISFDVAAGETLAIVGPSAAGKTTLVRLIVGACPPSSGNIRLDGADIFPWNRDDLGRHIGYLPQEVALFSGTVAENIARLQDADSTEIIEAARRANVHEMILRLPNGYDTQIGDGAVRLSGGQRQRIALARALYGRPSLVVLDEPNANLDTEGDTALVRALTELKMQNTTVVFITHRPGLIAYADKLLLLREGMAEMFGPRQEILERLKLHLGPSALHQLAQNDGPLTTRRRNR